MLDCNTAYIANWYFGSDYSKECATEGYSDGYSDYTQEKRKLHIVQYLSYSNYVSFTPWDRGQIGIELRTKHVAY